ncbi:D-TA family PLP-dependent enzyme [Prosthecomicrobium pneumaticum]|uniref:D-serine deaminase-like pyridoxal phosphate-dependent protein n=1 Tax=Prosthecomicrobium pneumaticum TaxID=81895 RepID=A0A7W9FK33_9HYPH|nr:D-TA family PLP-dependent enzyme [Prosthecomicrobium pneumaticum]MBB5752231.1 D-serine deaminase-like pyridoxal phosphate-dependent protein [Prosthecomicrobium pneumaticum]
MTLPKTIDDIETPAVLIDVDRVEANLARAQAYADEHRLALRPHIKTHKLPAFAKRQVELGAVGITCQKLGESEVMADGGLSDIYMPYNILGKAKLARLAALADRITIKVTADSLPVVEGLSGAFAGRAAPIAVLVECDTGAGRCGVQSPEAALALAQAIDRAPGLVFGGLMTYPPVGGMAAVDAYLGEALRLHEAAGLEVKVVSAGNTPDLYRSHLVTHATEIRPGTYIYNDRSLINRGAATHADCALTVLTTVVSRPTADRAVLDAGSKALTSDLLGCVGYGEILEAPGAVIAGLSEEHGHVDLSAATARPSVGDRVRVLPNHACPVSNLFDIVHLVSGERVVDVLPVAARGKVT